jgi:MtaA/CmuA family methyltransferase
LPISKKHLLENPQDLSKLKIPKPDSGKRMLDRLNAIELFQQKSKKEIPIMGWVEGSLAEAGDLRGVSNILMDLYERPEWVKELLDMITELEVDFAIQQIKAGADIIGLGDAIASQLSPELYQEFALPYEQRIFHAVKENGGIARLHICGDTNSILKSMTQSGADIIDLDWMVDINEAESFFGKDLIFCGNMDPVSLFLNGSVNDVYTATSRTLSNSKSKIISAGGCEIPMGTPDENINAQNRALILS